MSGITIFIIIGVVFFLFLIIYFISKSNKKNINETTNKTLIGNTSETGFYKVYTINGLQLVRKLEEMFENNEGMDMRDIVKLLQKMCNINHKIEHDELQLLIGIDGYMEEPEGSLKCIAGEYFMTLTLAISERNSSQYYKLNSYNETETMDSFGINIHSNELMYKHFYKTDWYEEKTITTSYNYGGFQYRLGGITGFSYRLGNLSVNPVSSQKFIPVDRGELFITNKRIIFVGKEKRVNKSINLDDILEFSIFKDGILIGKSNGKKPLIYFPEYIRKSDEAPEKRDDLNIAVRVLDRVLNKNQDENIIEYVSEDEIVSEQYQLSIGANDAQN